MASRRTGGSAANRTNLPIIRGQRYEMADKFIEAQSEAFIITGRRSVHFQVQLNIARHALNRVGFSREEQSLYGPWLKLNSTEAYDLGRSRLGEPSEPRDPSLPTVEVTDGLLYDAAAEGLTFADLIDLNTLRERDDPLAHFIDTMEDIRTTRHPEFDNEIRSRIRVQGAYLIMHAGIHSN